jgi:hypothetical protein
LFLVEYLETGVAQSLYLTTHWTKGVRSLAESRDISSSLCVQTGSWGPPSHLSNGYRGPLLGGKARPGCDADHSPPVGPRLRMNRSFSPLEPAWCKGTAFTYFPYWLSYQRSLFIKVKEDPVVSIKMCPHPAAIITCLRINTRGSAGAFVDCVSATKNRSSDYYIAATEWRQSRKSASTTSQTH